MKILPIVVVLLFVTGSPARSAEVDYLGVSESSPEAEISIFRGIPSEVRGTIFKSHHGFGASILSITAQDQGAESLKRKIFGTLRDVHVKPGIYVVRVECTAGPLRIVMDFPPISTEAGYAYHLGCVGTNPYNVRPRIDKQPIAELEKNESQEAASRR